MAIIDQNCAYLGIPTYLLMENAGKAVCQEVITKNSNIANKKIFIFAGTGNNGGDSFVAARHLAYYKPEITLLLLGRSSEIRTEISKMNWDALGNMEYSIQRFEIINVQGLSNLAPKISSADIIIDGLLGTEIKWKLREPISTAIDLINESKAFKVAIDVPSGLDPLNGNIRDKAIKADLTVTFHKPKTGLKNNDQIIGKLIISEIGIPMEAEFNVGAGDIKNLRNKRNPNSYKGQFGKILVIGGSKYYAGAPALVGLAAYRTGADLVIIASPEKIANNIRSYSPNLIVRDLPGDILSDASLQIINELINWATAVAIGPGLGGEEETHKMVLKIIENTQKKNIPTVIDADAIKAVAQNLEILSNPNIILTPHQGEFKILSKIDVYNLDFLEKLKKVVDFTKKLGVTILLKGHKDIITNGKKIKINSTGTPAMTVGGTGDVLTGIISCLIGQKLDIFNSAACAAFLNGKAGEFAEKKFSGSHLMATDLIDFIPEAFHI